MLKICQTLDWGSVPDWVEAVGSILAFLAAAALIGFEMRARRMDLRRYEEERLDAQILQARLVATGSSKIYSGLGGGGSITRVSVFNNSSAVVLDIEISLVLMDGAVRHVRSGTRARLEPGRRHDMELGPFEDGLSTDVEAFADLRFTDANGFRWHRHGTDQPTRVLGKVNNA